MMQLALHLASVSAAAPAAIGTPSAWPQWESYVRRFLSADGRIVDPEGRRRTTSEGQAYGMFFALVANDRPRFDRLLAWTENNLAAGDLSRQLPSWEWGEGRPGIWTVRDRNSASDADLWIAYTLLEAGRLWGDSRLSQMGLRMANRIAAEEVVRIPGLGTMLLPGPRGFVTTDDSYLLNPSYVPLQVLLGIAEHHRRGPWKEIAANVPALIRGSAPRGFAPDWVGYHPERGFYGEAPRGQRPLASYDGIRVYLWAGMLPDTVGERRALLNALDGMAKVVTARKFPPAVVDLDGVVEQDQGSVGFSASLIPYLEARGDRELAALLKQRVRAAWNPTQGVYGAGAYYDQNLVLFSNGWLDGRYRFQSDGSLRVGWKDVR